MKKLSLLSVAAFAALAVTGAQAATVGISFSGTVLGVTWQTYGTDISTTNGTGDVLGAFGGGSLTSQGFTLSASWDPAQLNAGDYVNVPDGVGANSGWVNDPTVNSTFSYGITINSQTVGDTNNSAGGLINLDLSYNGPTPPSSAGAYMGAQVYHPDTGAYSTGPAITNNSFLIYSTTPFSSSPDSGNNIENQAYMTAFADNLCVGFNGTGNCRFFLDVFTPNVNGYRDTQEVITLQGFSGTPEPATWFSLAIGLAGLATLKWRRRAVRG
ncbi:MAG TPA: PEP-CTERM sorting domain-containing protein [Bryobacteraceae bacterium]|nr:PEP-CTERM sorting domain-containing protein [Bryobacteraceae bacterium]